MFTLFTKHLNIVKWNYDLTYDFRKPIAAGFWYDIATARAKPRRLWIRGKGNQVREIIWNGPVSKKNHQTLSFDTPLISASCIASRKTNARSALKRIVTRTRQSFKNHRKNTTNFVTVISFSEKLIYGPEIRYSFSSNYCEYLFNTICNRSDECLKSKMSCIFLVHANARALA